MVCTRDNNNNNIYVTSFSNISYCINCECLCHLNTKLVWYSDGSCNFAYFSKKNQVQLQLQMDSLKKFPAWMGHVSKVTLKISKIRNIGWSDTLLLFEHQTFLVFRSPLQLALYYTSCLSAVSPCSSKPLWATSMSNRSRRSFLWMARSFIARR